jgi:hypothetical protein
VAATARRPVFPEAPVIRIGFVRFIVHFGASADGAGVITTAPAGQAVHDGKRRRGLWLREKTGEVIGLG